MADKQPLAADVVECINSAIPTIRDLCSKDPAVCVGYMWATLAHIVELCGQPKPVAPWRQTR